jgi:hypothetical protein
MKAYTITLTDPSEIEIFEEIKNSLEIRRQRSLTDAEVIKYLASLFYHTLGR